VGSGLASACNRVTVRLARRGIAADERPVWVSVRARGSRLRSIKERSGVLVSFIIGPISNQTFEVIGGASYRATDAEALPLQSWRTPSVKRDLPQEIRESLPRRGSPAARRLREPQAFHLACKGFRYSPKGQRARRSLDNRLPAWCACLPRRRLLD
jgi:hypothetical protein